MRRARGFTLIEVLAAFAVLAIGVAVVAGMLNGGRRQVRYAAELSYAAQLAQSVLDGQGLSARLHEGEDEGDSPDRHMHWHLQIREITDPLADRELIERLQQDASAELLAHLEAAQAAGGAGNGNVGERTPTNQPTALDTSDPTLGTRDEQSPWQLMQLALDVEWGEGARERARFDSVRVQIRAPDDSDGAPARAGAPEPAASPAPGATRK